MFGANSAVACCDSVATPKPAVTLPGVPALTNMRSVPFPMTDPYSPVRNAAVPVPGFDVWPPRRNVMGRRYYGLGKNAAGTRSRGMGGVFDSFFTSGNVNAGNIGSGGNSTLQSILSTIQTTLPATISAIKGKPYYDPSRQQVVYVGAGGGAQQGQTVYDAQGNVSQVGATLGGAVGNVGDSLGNIVAQHPYLVLLVGGALVLMFMKPPGRR